MRNIYPTDAAAAEILDVKWGNVVNKYGPEYWRGWLVGRCGWLSRLNKSGPGLIPRRTYVATICGKRWFFYVILRLGACYQALQLRL
jgi:hypothetical protein